MFVIPLGPYFRDTLKQESFQVSLNNSATTSPTLVQDSSSTAISGGDNGNCTDTDVARPIIPNVDEVNANSVQLSNGNNGFISASTSVQHRDDLDNDNDIVTVTNGDLANPIVELVSEAIDLEEEEPNH